MTVQAAAAPQLPATPAPAARPATVDLVGNVAPATPAEVPVASPPTDNNATSQSGTPASTPLSGWAFGTQCAKGHDFASVGDPHETTLAGEHFDNQRAGVFTKLKSSSGDFELQTRQAQTGAPGIMANDAAAVKMDKDVVSFDAKTNELTVNGKKTDIAPGQTIKLDGGTVTAGQQPGTIDLESNKGDHVSIQSIGGFMNVTGHTGKDRKEDEVEGELGQLHGATADQQMDKWQAKDGDSLFDQNKPADPAGGGAPAANGQDPTAAQGAGAPQGADGNANANPEQQIVQMLQQLVQLLGGANAQPQAPGPDPNPNAPAGQGAADPNAPAGQGANGADPNAAAGDPNAPAGQGAPDANADPQQQVQKVLAQVLQLLLQMMQQDHVRPVPQAAAQPADAAAAPRAA